MPLSNNENESLWSQAHRLLPSQHEEEGGRRRDRTTASSGHMFAAESHVADMKVNNFSDDDGGRHREGQEKGTCDVITLENQTLSSPTEQVCGARSEQECGGVGIRQTGNSEVKNVKENTLSTNPSTSLLAGSFTTTAPETNSSASPQRHSGHGQIICEDGAGGDYHSLRSENGDEPTNKTSSVDDHGLVAPHQVEAAEWQRRERKFIASRIPILKGASTPGGEEQKGQLSGLQPLITATNTHTRIWHKSILFGLLLRSPAPEHQSHSSTVVADPIAHPIVPSSERTGENQQQRNHKGEAKYTPSKRFVSCWQLHQTKMKKSSSRKRNVINGASISIVPTTTVMPKNSSFGQFSRQAERRELPNAESQRPLTDSLPPSMLCLLPVAGSQYDRNKCVRTADSKRQSPKAQAKNQGKAHLDSSIASSLASLEKSVASNFLEKSTKIATFGKSNPSFLAALPQSDSKRRQGELMLGFTPFSLLYNECSMSAISRWAHLSNKEAADNGVPQSDCREALYVPAAPSKFRLCSICNKFGHYEVQCAELDTAADDILLKCGDSLSVQTTLNSFVQQYGHGEIDEEGGMESEVVSTQELSFAPPKPAQQIQVIDESLLPSKFSSCEICRSSYHDEALLLCDGCDRMFHTMCLDPPLDHIPDGDWFCPYCEESAEDVDSDIEIEGYQGIVIEQRKRKKEYLSEELLSATFGVRIEENQGWVTAIGVADKASLRLRAYSRKVLESAESEGKVALKEGELCWAMRRHATKGKLGREDWWPASITSIVKGQKRSKIQEVVVTPYLVRMFRLCGASRTRASHILPFLPHFEELGYNRAKRFNKEQVNVEGSPENLLSRGITEAIGLLGFSSLSQALKKSREALKVPDRKQGKKLKCAGWDTAKRVEHDGFMILARGCSDEERIAKRARFGGKSHLHTSSDLVPLAQSLRDTRVPGCVVAWKQLESSGDYRVKVGIVHAGNALYGEALVQELSSWRDAFVHRCDTVEKESAQNSSVLFKTTVCHTPSLRWMKMTELQIVSNGPTDEEWTFFVQEDLPLLISNTREKVRSQVVPKLDTSSPENEESSFNVRKKAMAMTNSSRSELSEGMETKLASNAPLSNQQRQQLDFGPVSKLSALEERQLTTEGSPERLENVGAEGSIVPLPRTEVQGPALHTFGQGAKSRVQREFRLPPPSQDEMIDVSVAGHGEMMMRSGQDISTVSSESGFQRVRKSLELLSSEKDTGQIEKMETDPGVCSIDKKEGTEGSFAHLQISADIQTAIRTSRHHEKESPPPLKTGRIEKKNSDNTLTREPSSQSMFDVTKMERMLQNQQPKSGDAATLEETRRELKATNFMSSKMISESDYDEQHDSYVDTCRSEDCEKGINNTADGNGGEGDEMDHNEDTDRRHDQESDYDERDLGKSLPEVEREMRERGIFQVEDILDERRTSSGREYLIRWKNFPVEDSTWEPERNILNKNFVRRFKFEKYSKQLKATEEAKKNGSVSERVLAALEEGMKVLDANPWFKPEGSLALKRVCPFCRQVFKDGNGVNAHIKIHSNSPNFEPIRECARVLDMSWFRQK